MSSTFNVIARYRTRPGTTEEILTAIGQLARASRREPGNISYEFFRGVEDERQIVILEAYRSSEDFDAHRITPHFLEIGIGRIVPSLESRTVTTFESPEETPAAR